MPYIHSHTQLKISVAPKITIFILLQRKKAVQPKPISKRPRRVVVKPNRLGRRESAVNHNDFFRNLNKKNDENCELVKTTTSQEKGAESAVIVIDVVADPVHSVDTIQQKCCSHDAEFKSLMIAHMTAMKEQLIRIEAKISHRSNENRPHSFGIADAIELKRFGTPVDSEDGLNALNEHLTDEIFKNGLVRIVFLYEFYIFMCKNNNQNMSILFQFDVLKNIGGDTGASDGNTIIESVVYALIDPVFLGNISWSGRGGKNETKIALKKKPNINNLIIYTIGKADGKLNSKDILKLLKYKVLKRAGKKAQDILNGGEDEDDLEHCGAVVSSAHRYFVVDFFSFEKIVSHDYSDTLLLVSNSQCSTRSTTSGGTNSKAPSPSPSVSSVSSSASSLSLSTQPSTSSQSFQLPVMNSVPNFGQPFFGQYHPGMGTYPMGVWPFNHYQKSDGAN